MHNCVVCRRNIKVLEAKNDSIYGHFDYAACGRLVVNPVAQDRFANGFYDEARLYISHQVRWSQRDIADAPVIITRNLVDFCHEEARDFTPVEQADNLI